MQAGGCGMHCADESNTHGHVTAEEAKAWRASVEGLESATRLAARHPGGAREHQR